MRVPFPASIGSGFTHEFEQQTAYLAVNASQKVVAELMRIAWRTVGRILQRIVSLALEGRDLLDGVTRIGIDETSYRHGHRYLTVVVCHDSGRLIWAAPGRNKATLKRFFNELGPERRAGITHASADGAAWIHDTVRAKCPNAVVCMDAFHIVKWVNETVDKIRREFWNDTRKHRKRGRPPKDLKAASCTTTACTRWTWSSVRGTRPARTSSGWLTSPRSTHGKDRSTWQR